MRRKSVIALLALSVPVTVSACEGECIVKITNAYVGNYTTPVDAVMRTLAGHVASLLPSHPDIPTAASYLAPLLSAYDAAAYTGMETAIFPSFFHGKCAQHGADPPGCPNPDCPVVCGTPGSMVHFFPTLRYLAYNETRARIEAAADPGGDAYKQVEQNVLDAANDHKLKMRLGRISPRMPSKTNTKAKAKTGAKVSATPKVMGRAEAAPDDHIFVPVFARAELLDDLSSGDLSQLSELTRTKTVFARTGIMDDLSPGDFDPLSEFSQSRWQCTVSETATAPASDFAPDDHIFIPVLARTSGADSEETIKEQLQAVLAQAGEILGQMCGDDGSGTSVENLARCSWAAEMKEYILTFP
ncbi:uncharacterized protein B0H18DRAFT_984519 [Fomitopsis serialis]|uniref:uncharacterized protein n=1 Tax=Fomitopsis serialis TaxID=139415 RepID=UPI0020082255|nr:uncharacterized protein B0H18DRAFT_984519 [Neoantrodia serialis]KAH9932900.1 hypothetical protein B0H18DRAFT_984519 [Neoantrodia serialis]